MPLNPKRTVADLKEMAGKIIQARKDAEKQIDGFKTARENMQKVVATLGKQQQSLETEIEQLLFRASLLCPDCLS